MIKKTSLMLWRAALALGGVALILLIAAGLALRFWIMPSVEEYKPRITQAISDATGLSSRLTKVSARWEGLRPVLTMQGIEFYDSEGRSVLGFNRVEGVLSWWTVPARKPQFLSLEIARPNLTVRRDGQGRVFVAGVVLSDEQTGRSGFAEWLLHQPSIAVRGAQIEWIDELRRKAPLKLSEADLTLENHGSERKLTLRASPPAHLATDLQLVAELRGTDPQRLEEWSGKIYAAADNANLVTINDYVPLSSRLRSGAGSVKAWVDVSAGRATGVTAEVDLREVHARLRDDLTPIHLTTLVGRFGYTQGEKERSFVARGLSGQFVSPRVRLQPTDLDLTVFASPANDLDHGTIKANQIDLGALVALAAALPLPETDRARLRAWMPSGVLKTVEARWEGLERADRAFALRAQFTGLGWQAVEYMPGANGLSGSVDATQAGGTLSLDSGKSALSFPKVFADTLRFDTLSAQASWQREGAQTVVKIQNAGFANADVAGSAFGTYKTALPAAAGQPVPKRAPGWIDLTGKIVRARGENVERYIPLVLGPRVRGWLDHAIETGRGKEATLTLKGDLYHFPFADDKDGIFDINAEVEDVRLWYANDWPKLERVKGKLHFRGARMEITGEGSVFGARVQGVRAVIPVLGNHKEVLQISGESSVALPDALRFIAASPVNDKLHRRTEGLRGSGGGKLKLQLELPLHALHASKINGEYEFMGNALDDAQRGFPALSQIKGKLQFTGGSVSAKDVNAVALGGPVAIELTSGNDGIAIAAKGEADLAQLHREYAHALLKGLAGRAQWGGKMQLSAQALQLNVAASGNVLGAPAKFDIVRTADGKLRIDGRGSAQQAELAKTLPDIDWSLVDRVGDWRAQLNVAGQQTQVKLEADATVLGKPARISAQGPSENLRVAAEGSIDARRLAQLYPGVWSERLTGETQWRAELNAGAGPAASKANAQDASSKSKLRIVSDLRGLASNLPAPFAKNAADSLPLSIDLSALRPNEELVRVSLGDRASAQIVRARTPEGKSAVARATLRFGGMAPVPQEPGVSVAGNVDDFDLGTWLDLQREAARDAGAKQGASDAMPPLSAVDISAKRFAAIGRVFDDVNMRVRKEGGGWQVALSGAQMLGHLRWLSGREADSPSGKLVGKFERLIMPAAPAQTKSAAASKVPLRPSEFPALDFSVQAFQIKQRRLGTLRLLALPEGNTWRINTLSLTSPAAAFTAIGLWSGVNETPGTGIEGNWKIADLGAFMDAMGFPGTIAGGAAELQGRLAWAGAPFDFDTTSLGGELKLSVKEGRFLKLDPGAGKLLSLISLQALPRRITLDFRDVFSEGFAFDAIKARVAIGLGVLRTDDFEMRGTGARVRMAGEADARSETQNLRVKVLPALGGTVAVAGTIAGGPVAGVGAYVLQKILNEPFDEILAYEYEVTGAWSDPAVKRIARPQPPERPRPR